MQKTTLVIMAAGMGSRFGSGIKQLTPVGPSGEIIMDYSIHDALEAGFNKIVFIIRRDLEKDFQKIIGNRIQKFCEVAYAYQELDQLPEGFSVPEGRIKPWGTGHAVLTCKELIHEPFAVINADDYYGKQAFTAVHDFLVTHAETRYEYCMAGFLLKNTLSDYGGVSRGICKIDTKHNLINIVETHNIVKSSYGARSGDSGMEIDTNLYVSMNMWGLTPEFFNVLEEKFVDFLENSVPEDIKAEYLMPTIIGKLVNDHQAIVSVLETTDKWFGVTYAEDRKNVENAFRELTKAGLYTSPLNA